MQGVKKCAEAGNVRPLLVECADKNDNLKKCQYIKLEHQIRICYSAILVQKIGTVFIPDHPVLAALEKSLADEKHRLRNILENF